MAGTGWGPGRGGAGAHLRMSAGGARGARDRGHPRGAPRPPPHSSTAAPRGSPDRDPCPDAAPSVSRVGPAWGPRQQQRGGGRVRAPPPRASGLGRAPSTVRPTRGVPRPRAHAPAAVPRGGRPLDVRAGGTAPPAPYRRRKRPLLPGGSVAARWGTCRPCCPALPAPAASASARGSSAPHPTRGPAPIRAGGYGGGHGKGLGGTPISVRCPGRFSWGWPRGCPRPTGDVDAVGWWRDGGHSHGNPPVSPLPSLPPAWRLRPPLPHGVPGVVPLPPPCPMAPVGRVGAQGASWGGWDVGMGHGGG